MPNAQMHALFIWLFQMLYLLLICTFSIPIYIYTAFGNHMWMTLSALFYSSLSSLYPVVLLLFKASRNHKFGWFNMGKWRKKDDILTARAVYSLTLSPPSFQFTIHFLFRSRLCKSKKANLPILLWTSVTAFNCPFLQTSGKARRRTNPRGKKPVEWMQKELKKYQASWSETNSEIPCCHLFFFQSSGLKDSELQTAKCCRSSVPFIPLSLAHSGLCSFSLLHSLVSSLPFSLAFCLTLAICLPVWFTPSSAFFSLDASSSEYWSFQHVVWKIAAEMNTVNLSLPLAPSSQLVSH